MEQQHVVRAESDWNKLFSRLMQESIDKPLEVTWRPYKEDKTAEQRGWFHILCGLLGKATGYTMGEVKEMVKQDTLGTVVVKIGNREKEVTRSSESAKRDEYSELIEAVYRLGAEAGINLPPPKRKWDEVMARRYR